MALNGNGTGVTAQKKKVRKVVTLREWIDETGIDEVAKLLKTDRSAPGHWRRRFCLPSSRQMAAITRFSKGAVDWNSEITSFYKSAKG